ncbi:glycosyltransferase family 2 protein [Ekhidna sp.]|uniref:glycosyltransferase family 2 protein n=1 Tax=Ekhidna sp. TaxID=2608089 RepID=UPI003514B141
MSYSLVSIITPVYNTESFLAECIQSVLCQDYQSFELILINDGSTDRSKDIIHSFDDSRIRYFEQTNQGVSAARNVGLANMQGEFFCFLDADDVMPPHSLSSRIKHFRTDEHLDVIDGKVVYADSQLSFTGEVYQPNYRGNPKDQLLKISRCCFFGPSWMIRRRHDLHYAFDTELSHSEDLLFYLSLTFQKNIQYGFVSEGVLIYRQNENSAMTNLLGLERGYRLLLSKLWKFHPNKISIWQMLRLKLKVTKIMFLSHLFDGKDLMNAVRSMVILFK